MAMGQCSSSDSLELPRLIGDGRYIIARGKGQFFETITTYTEEQTANAQPDDDGRLQEY